MYFINSYVAFGLLHLSIVLKECRFIPPPLFFITSVYPWHYTQVLKLLSCHSAFTKLKVEKSPQSENTEREQQMIIFNWNFNFQVILVIKISNKSLQWKEEKRIYSFLLWKYQWVCLSLCVCLWWQASCGQSGLLTSLKRRNTTPGYDASRSNFTAEVCGLLRNFFSITLPSKERCMSSGGWARHCHLSFRETTPT